MCALRSVWASVAVVLVVSVMVLAQNASNKEIKRVRIKQTSAASGSEMYQTYCATCHGTEGKGNGPAAEVLKVPPTDLTAIAQKNGGKYPWLRVAATIRGEQAVAAHGSKDMPVWGHLFWSMSGGHEGQVQQRVANLNKYVESLQKM